MSTPMSSNNNSGTGSRAASLRGFVRGRHRILRGLSAVATVAMTSLVSIGVVAVTSAPANAASTCTQNISGTTIPNITQFQFFNSERTMLQGLRMVWVPSTCSHTRTLTASTTSR